MLKKKMSLLVISSMTADSNEAENTIYLDFSSVWKSTDCGMPLALLPLLSLVKLMFLFLEIFSAQMDACCFMRDFLKITL